MTNLVFFSRTHTTIKLGNFVSLCTNTTPLEFNKAAQAEEVGSLEQLNPPDEAGKNEGIDTNRTYESGPHLESWSI